MLDLYSFEHQYTKKKLFWRLSFLTTMLQSPYTSGTVATLPEPMTPDARREPRPRRVRAAPATVQAS